MSTQEQAAPKRRSSRANASAKRSAAATQQRAQAARAEGAVKAEAPTTPAAAAAAPAAPVAAPRPRVVDGAERTEQAKAEGIARRERKAAAEAEAEGGIKERLGGRFEPLQRFTRETMAEIRKVNWPDQETTRNLTILVIAVSAVLGIFLGGIDFVLLKIFEALP